jgi:hypothetical protein
MKISETFEYPGTDVEGVYALITDQNFRAEATAVDAIDYEVTVEASTVTILRTMDNDMPDFIKKLAGETVKVKQTEHWSEPAADASRSADVKVTIIGQPAEMRGTASITPNSEGARFSLEGDVKVSIPFIGKKIEHEVAKAIIAALKNDVAMGIERL